MTAMQQNALPRLTTDFFARFRAQCASRIERSTVLLYGIQDDQLKHDRTGVLYKVGGDDFILTASHDLNGIVKNNIPLYVDRADGHTLPIPLANAVFHGTEKEPRDVAAIKLPDSVVRQLAPNKEFLTQADITLSGTNANALCALFGYPKDWSGVVTETGFVSNPLGYLCRRHTGETDPGKYVHPDLHVVLEFCQTAVDIVDGSAAQLPRLKGVSGCGIWRVAELSKEGSRRWRPDQLRLVALQHSWHQQMKYVRGTWIVHALALVRDQYPDVAAAMRLVYPGR